MDKQQVAWECRYKSKKCLVLGSNTWNVLKTYEKLGFQHIEIVVRKDNIASFKVAEKVGAVREGLLRNRLQVHGIASDAYIHSPFPSDYGIPKTT